MDPPLLQIRIDLGLVVFMQLPASLAKCRISLNLWDSLGLIKFLPPEKISDFATIF
jgi:hypothetical protein